MIISYFIYILLIYITKGVKVDDNFNNLSKDIPYPCQDFTSDQCVNLLWGKLYIYIIFRTTINQFYV